MSKFPLLESLSNKFVYSGLFGAIIGLSVGSLAFAFSKESTVGIGAGIFSAVCGMVIGGLIYSKS